MKQILALDSSQISTLIHCPFRWYLAYHKRLQKRHLKTDAWDRGTILHFLLQTFNNQIWGNNSIEGAVKYTFCQLKAQTIPAAIKEEIPFLRQRFLEYTAHWEIPQVASVKDTEGANKPATEVGFSEIIYEDDEVIFILEGRIDLILHMGDKQIWRDYKTQSRKSELYPLSTQFRNYCFITGLPGQIDYIGLQDKINPDTFRRSHLITLTEGQKAQWLKYLKTIYYSVLSYKNTPTQPPQYLGTACEGNYGIPCQFTKVCEETNPRIQEGVIQIEYEVREKWEPWKLLK